MKKLINLILLAWVCIAPQTYAMRICGGWLVRYTTEKVNTISQNDSNTSDRNDSQVVSMVFIPDNNKTK